MPLYEHVYLARQDLSAQQVEEMTATFKYTKNSLLREGFDPAAADDVIYFNDRQRAAFVPLDRNLYDRVRTGQVRL